MAINWQPTLAELDTRLAGDALSDPARSLAAKLANDLRSAGGAYDRAFPPGARSTLSESSEHSAWAIKLLDRYRALDQLARAAEAEAVAANGHSLIVGDVLLAPDVAMPFVSSSPQGAETFASGAIGNARFQAREVGGLGNAISITVTPTFITVGAPAGTSTSNYTLDGVAHVQVTEVSSTLQQVPSAPQIVGARGSYSESWPDHLLFSMLVPPAPGTAGVCTLSGGSGEFASVTRRLERALVLPGVSAGTTALIAQAAAARSPTEPQFYDARYYQNTPLRLQTQGTREGIAASIERQRLRSLGLLPPLVGGPTYGEIELALSSALETAKAWLHATA